MNVNVKKNKVTLNGTGLEIGEDGKTKVKVKAIVKITGVTMNILN